MIRRRKIEVTEHFCSQRCEEAHRACGLCFAQRRHRSAQRALAEARPTLQYQPFANLVLPSRTDQGSMRRIIFQDIDGVLNNPRHFKSLERVHGVGNRHLWKPSEYLDPARVALLCELQSATLAEIVISSKWRTTWKVPQIATLLESMGLLRGAVTGATPILSGRSRHIEIRAWLVQQCPVADRFVIFDDDEEAGVGFGRRFIHVPDGLERAHVDLALEILR